MHKQPRSHSGEENINKLNKTKLLFQSYFVREGGKNRQIRIQSQRNKKTNKQPKKH